MLDTLHKLRHLLSRREKRQALVLFVLMMLGGVLEMIGVGAIPAFVAMLDSPDRLLQYDLARQTADRLGITTHTQLVLWGAGALAVIFVLKNSYLAALAYANARYTNRRGVTIGRRLFRAYLRSPYTFHLQRNTADLLRNTQTESRNAVRQVLVPGLLIVMEALTLTTILALLFVAEPVVSLVAAAGLGAVCGSFYYVLRNKLSHYGQERQYYSGKMLQSVNEGLGGIKTTKLLGRERYFEKSFSDHASRLADASIFQSFTNSLPRLFIETAAIAGLLLIAVTFVAQGRSLSTIIPTLTLFAAASVRLIPSFNRITQSVNKLRYGHHAVDVIYDDLRALEHEAARNGRAKAALPLDDAITMRDVHYRYPGAGEWALQGITLEIPRGSAVAFVGPSGAGKTTAVNALLGLLDPTHGRICVDGTDLREHLEGWQRQIGYIPQDIYLSDATIRENVAFGLKGEDIDEEAVRRAVRSAQLDDLLGRLPEGLDTVVGERGVRLSGGQKQRIGIARALYHNPQVLVMDEATSDLDNQTERYLMEAIERLRGDRTLIMIAHRLTTVQGCDCLFFLKDGRLDAVGAYDELLHTSRGFQAMAAA